MGQQASSAQFYVKAGGLTEHAGGYTWSVCWMHTWWHEGSRFQLSGAPVHPFIRRMLWQVRGRGTAAEISRRENQIQNGHLGPDMYLLPLSYSPNRRVQPVPGSFGGPTRQVLRKTITRYDSTSATFFLGTNLKRCINTPYCISFCYQCTKGCVKSNGTTLVKPPIGMVMAFAKGQGIHH